MKKKKTVLLDWSWQFNHWHLLPTVTLDNYENQFDIHFMFLGFWFEVAFMK